MQVVQTAAGLTDNSFSASLPNLFCVVLLCLTQVMINVVDVRIWQP
jgi:hypothetical protein